MRNSIEQQIIEFNEKKFYHIFSNTLIRIKATHITAIIVLLINSIFFTDNFVSQSIQFILVFIIILHDFDDIYLKRKLSENICKLNSANKILEQHNLELKQLATIDFLTNIPNRRYFFDMGEKEFYLAKRYKSIISLVFLDIDYFKKINDNYGHSIGDEALLFVSEIITNNIRKSDLYGRMGGEEFAIMLINTNLNEAKTYCDNLRKEIQKNKFIKDEIKIEITVSIGVTSINKSDINLNDLFKRSDEALYLAKKTGRNKVC